MIPANTLEKLGFEGIRSTIASYIRTPDGSELVKNYKPLAAPSAIDQVRSETREMLLLLESGATFPLDQLEDISEWLAQSRPVGTMLPVHAFPGILAQLRSSRLTRSFFYKQKSSAPTLAQIVSELPVLQEFESMIANTVSDQGEVKESASPELKRIRNRLNGQRQTLRNTIQKLFRKLTGEGVVSDEGPTLRGGRMVIPVKAEYKRKLDGFVHDVSSSGQTVYLEPVESLHINNEIRELELEETREIARILIALTDRVRHYREPLELMSRILGQMDLIHARCKAGTRWNGVLPALSTDRQIVLQDAGNPSLLLKNSKLNPDKRDPVVPLNLEFSNEEAGVIVSGPNAGGKSVALKTVGLLVCMHQCGIPLPLDPDSKLPLFSSLYLDMGDEQSIENDLSTFSSRLDWMRQTVESADRNSLVLIDEAGSGTDPDEGSALFQAYMEFLLSVGARFLATTHHNALKQFANNQPGICNAAMEFDQQTLTPTYRFRKDIPGSSYAFEIADRLRFPTGLLERARELLGDHHDRMTHLLLDLETELQASRKARLKFEQERTNAEKQSESYKRRSEEIEEKQSDILKEAYEKADAILKEANRKVEQAVEMIVQQGKQDRARVKEARRLVEDEKSNVKQQLKDRHRRSQERPEKSSWKPALGDYVRISDSKAAGELVELEGRQAVVLAGGMKIKTTVGKLIPTERPDKTSGTGKLAGWKKRDHISSIDRKSVGPSLDIRGERGTEAVNRVMHYIDNAIAAGLQEVDIIHGTGEGILKRLVREHLNERSDIAGYEDAPLERGGAGCTIVTI